MSYGECTDAATKKNTLFLCICSKDENKLLRIVYLKCLSE